MTQEQIEKEFKKKIKRLICCSAATPLRFGVLGEDDTGIEARAFTTNDDFQLLLKEQVFLLKMQILKLYNKW